MAVEPRDLDEFHRAWKDAPAWGVDLVQREVGGGRIDASEFAAIEERPEATALRVSGLTQKTFEELVTRHGHQFRALMLWKCPRIEDLTPLETLPHLRLVSIYWNQRTTRLWDLTRTPELTGLRFEDFTRLHRLDDLRAGTELTELAIGDAIDSTSTYETLDPIGDLTTLRTLSVLPKRIDDGRIQPLGRLTGLTHLRIPANLFTTEQIAWLRARLPDHVECAFLGPLMRLDKPMELGGRRRDVLLVGKGKGFLNSELDAARIAKHVAAFEAMLAAFRADPSREPA